MERHVGNYALGPLLARGGMSEVYSGHHRFLGDAVAIKLMRLPPGDADAVAEAVVAEATRTRAIDHPNVVRVLDVGRDDATGTCYLVMERVDGEDLAAHLARTGPLDEAEARRLGAAIADGLAAAHDRGIVHRDVKPANVMLGGGQPKLVDFGIAKALGDRSAVHTTRRIGTPAYMAPEQLVGGRIAPGVDIWALGAILFELVTGRTPFSGYDSGRCPQLLEPAPRVTTLAPVSPAYDALVAHCLEADPGLRPRAMTDVARALREPGTGDRHTVDLGAVAPGPAPAPAPASVAVGLAPTVAAELPARVTRPAWPLRVAIGTAAIAIAVIAIIALRAPAAGIPREVDAAGAAPPPDAALPVVDEPAPDAAPPPVDAPGPIVDEPPPDAAPPPDARKRREHHHDHGGGRPRKPDAREGLG